MERTHTIVVGIDFRTTYTAAAWADASNPGQIEIIKNRPTAGQLVGSEVPSDVAYDPTDRSKFTWGYSISPHAQNIKWFKLCLEMEQHVLELRFDLKSTDMICNYLSAIYKHVMATLHRRLDPAIMQKAARYYSLSALLRQQAIKSFEAAKVAFRDDAEQHDFYVNLPGVGDIQDAGVRSGNFHISREEMRALFDPVIDRIINLISSQIQGSIDRQFHPRNWWVRRIRVPIPALVQ